MNSLARRTKHFRRSGGVPCFKREATPRTGHSLEIFDPKEKVTLMKRVYVILGCTILLLALTASRVAAQGGTPLPAPISGTSPHVLFTDMDSGPNSGGENNNGTWLTIYGNNFGASQGSSSVTIGGGAVAAVKFWTGTKIAVQLGAAAKTGAVVVTVNGVASNSSVTFTVRAGNIRCVSTSGSDSSNGLWPNCQKTVPAAVHSSALVAGDIIYIRAGVTATGSDPIEGNGCNICISDTGGTAGNPIALSAYPGETVTLGSVNNNTDTIRVPNVANVANYWTIANLFLQGNAAIGVGGQVQATTGWRVIGNDMTCPNGTEGVSEDACFEADFSTFMKFYGNKVHDVSTSVSQSNNSKLYHAVYWSTDANHIDVGWNEVGPSKACRGIQFHSSPTGSGAGNGHQQFDLSVHDNYIHDIRCDGLNFATVDPSKGKVEAYNNIIVNAGAGPDPNDGSADYAGVYFAQILNAGSACSGSCNALVYNNTFYNNGAGGAGGSGQAAVAMNSGPVKPVITNNIIYANSGEAYFDVSTVTCSNNLFFGAGAAPSGCTSSLAVDPKFTANFTNFHPQSGSPAIDAGSGSACAATDKDGILRPQGSACDIGAYEFFTGAVAPPKPNPPTSPKLTVK